MLGSSKCNQHFCLSLARNILSLETIVYGCYVTKPSQLLFVVSLDYCGITVEIVQFVVISDTSIIPFIDRTINHSEYFLSNTPRIHIWPFNNVHDTATYVCTGLSVNLQLGVASSNIRSKYPAQPGQCIYANYARVTEFALQSYIIQSSIYRYPSQHTTSQDSNHCKDHTIPDLYFASLCWL